MVKLINSFRPLLIIATFLLVVSACKGPQGDPGPAGATGATGAAGAAGATGVAGNANVMQYSYSSKTHTGTTLLYTLTGMTAETVNKSTVFMYLQNASGYWYPIPGIFDGNFEYRINIRPAANTVVAVIRVGTTSTSTDTFAATRILIIPASDLRNGRKAAVDYTRYEEVKAYYNLPD